MRPRTACAACSARAAHTTVRDSGMGAVDTTLGLTDLGGDLWACPACGQRYRCRVEMAEPPYMFVDYDLYFYEKVEPVLTAAPPVARVAPAPAPAPAAPPPIYRCPACRSLDVGRNEARSAYEYTYMECAACGNGELVDWIERDDWVITVQDQEDARVAFGLRTVAPVAPVAPVSSEPVSAGAEPELGCVMCTGDDAEEAWEAMETHHVGSLVREVHFGVDVKRCFCDQLFAVVFTERIDFRDGDDDQTWLAVPITDEERARLEAAATANVPGALVAFVHQRRFLAKSRLADAPRWCEGGFSIFPHD